MINNSQTKSRTRAPKPRAKPHAATLFCPPTAVSN